MSDNKRIVVLKSQSTAVTNSWMDVFCKKVLPKFDLEYRDLNITPDPTVITEASIQQALEVNDIVTGVINDDRTKIVFMNMSEVGKGTCPQIINELTGMIRKYRKDLFLVALRHTLYMNEEEMYLYGLDICKKYSCNLVWVTDLVSGLRMVVAPEETQYHVTKNMSEAFIGLLEMVDMRSHLTFTQSTVIEGKPIAWDDPLVPDALRKVIDYCIDQNAYKPFNGTTAGHFACKLDDTTFLTSIRKTNFNDLANLGLVKCVTDGPDTVLAYGAKPSVGGQSQRIVFKDHPEYDSICHFHCPLKEGSLVPVMSQREVECGSHQCGNQTSKGLKKFGNLSAVYLDNHGPNIVFNKAIDPKEVIDFINDNFDLTKKTGGFESSFR